MTSLWWEITGAAAFGQAALAWRLREFGPFEMLRLMQAPGLALLVQAVVLAICGTSAAGITLSFICGTAALLLGSRFHRHRDNDDNENPFERDPR